MSRRVLMLALLALGGCDRLFFILEVEHNSDASLDLDSHVDIDAPDDAMLDAGMDARPVDPPGAVCPSNYGNVRGTSSYFHIATLLSWPAAQQVCLSHQITGSTKYTHLAVVSDDPERSFLYSNVIGSDGLSHWIGYTDRSIATMYRWVTDETGYPGNGDMPWASGQPSTTTGEDCATLNSVAAFVSADCSAKQFHYVCECDDHPNNAANY